MLEGLDSRRCGFMMLGFGPFGCQFSSCSLKVQALLCGLKFRDFRFQV